jgi:HK97 family phage major capsid protein
VGCSLCGIFWITNGILITIENLWKKLEGKLNVMKQWNKKLGIENIDIRAMSRSELKEHSKNVIEASKKLLDACDSEGRNLTKDEASAMDQVEKHLDDVENEINGRPSNFISGLCSGVSGEQKKAVKWEFGKIGASYRELHYNDSNHRFPTDRDIEDYLREVANNKIPSDTRAGTGFFPPEYWVAEMKDKASSQSIARPRVREYPTEGRDLHIALWDSLDQSAGFFGGVECEWVAEDGTFTDKDPDARQVSLHPKKCGLYVHATRELVEDAESISAVISQKLAFAVAQTVDEVVINGSGVGRPLGYLNADACLSVLRATANQIAYADVISLYSKIHPAFIGNSIWIANPECAPQLLGMVDGAGSYIWVPSHVTSAANAAPTTLLGRPLFWSDKVPGLGEDGDLSIADLSMYAYGERKGIIVESSNSPGWYRDRISFRAIIRADGTPLLSGPITPRNGSGELSAFAKLTV